MAICYCTYSALLTSKNPPQNLFKNRHLDGTLCCRLQLWMRPHHRYANKDREEANAETCKNIQILNFSGKLDHYISEVLHLIKTHLRNSNCFSHCMTLLHWKNTSICVLEFVSGCMYWRSTKAEQSSAHN